MVKLKILWKKGSVEKSFFDPFLFVLLHACFSLENDWINFSVYDNERKQ